MFLSSERNRKEAVKSIASKKKNRKCFNCKIQSTPYVVMDFGVFVCRRCAVIHRSFRHDARNIAMSNFTVDEFQRLKLLGNEIGEKKWKKSFEKKKYPIQHSNNVTMKFLIERTFIQKRWVENLNENFVFDENDNRINDEEGANVQRGNLNSSENPIPTLDYQNTIWGPMENDDLNDGWNDDERFDVQPVKNNVKSTTRPNGACSVVVTNNVVNINKTEKNSKTDKISSQMKKKLKRYSNKIKKLKENCNSLENEMASRDNFNNEIINGQMIEINKLKEKLQLHDSKFIIKSIEEQLNSVDKLKKLKVIIEDRINSFKNISKIIEDKVHLLIQKNLEEGKQLILCKICFERKVNMIMVPCGHSICDICCQKIMNQNKLCPFDRMKIESKNNLYF